MYILTSNIDIDKDKSLKYNELYIAGGSFKGVDVRGFISDSLIQINCKELEEGYNNLNVYLDIYRRTFITKKLPISNKCLSGSELLIHLGGVLVECECESKKFVSFLEREDECLTYKRGFDESFSFSFFDKHEMINICESVSKEFAESFNTDYNINETGDGVILDCRIYGDDVLVDGNIDDVDGNEPSTNCE